MCVCVCTKTVVFDEKLTGGFYWIKFWGSILDLKGRTRASQLFADFENFLYFFNFMDLWKSNLTIFN